MIPLDDLRKKLLSQRRQLFRDAAQAEEDLLRLETDVERELEERGQDEQMIRFLDRLDSRIKAELEAIDRALVKLDTGQYGQCEVCHRDIPQYRLEALPTATLCLACAQVREVQEALRK
jgi:DnaK suppressor protein